uniref:SID1 transmembrane family member 1 n=1 Tax=Plectus sambesii TaxID=2011161 RepID=A0A914WGB4_9BILA
MILRVLLLWLGLTAAPSSFAADVIDANLNQLYTNATEPNGVLSIYKYQVKQSQVVRVYLHSDNSSSVRPLLAVFREQRAVLSVQLPIRLEKNYFYDTVARTLCPFGNETLPANVGTDESAGAMTVELSCFSPTPVSYSLKAYLLDNFELTLGEQMSLSASPSQPVYLRYRIPKRLDSVVVIVKSNDEICMTVSIQMIGCPVFDLDNNVIFSGMHQTMTKQGAVPIQRSNLDDFYIVFVVKPNDDICSEMMSIQPASGPVHLDTRIKNFTVVIHELPTDSAYLVPMGVAVAAILVIYVLAFVHVSWVSIRDRRRWEEEGRAAVFGIDEETSSLNNPHYSYGATATSRSTISGSTEASDLPSSSGVSTIAGQEPSPDDINQPGPDLEISNEDADYDTLEDAKTDKSVARSKVNLMVSDLSLKPWKLRDKKYHLYTWNLLTIALFYALPVVQLVLTWQNTVRLSGDMDLCWYNYLCARPLFGIFAFNSIFSNIGYVMLGLLYLGMVKERELRYRRTVGAVHASVKTEFGIPMHNGLLYALGIAIMMEGILSASYHVCPSSSNYQFDTSFMYIIGALGMLKIYQLRHPDINANAHVAFGILALFIFLAMCGVYFNDVPFWAVFSVCYILVMFGVSVEFYFKGQWRLNRHIYYRLRHYWRSTTCISRIIPRFKGRFIFLLIGNLLNLSFVFLGIWVMPKDFPSFLLLPFTGNLFLYLMYYIFMKLLNKERLKMRTVLFLLMAIGCWVIAMWFFINAVSDWSETPAESRVKNHECILFNFYDNHDVWHFMSALSLFMSFSIFLSLDDGLQWVRRDKIVVF